MRFAPFIVTAFALLGCTPAEPPRWATGGAVLVVPNARWDRPGDEPVSIEPDGRVLEGGTLVFVVDRVGRVADADYEPLAVLFPEGRLAGTDQRELGHVGVSNAAPPGRVEAWLSVSPDGNVIAFADDGAREPAGQWTGCGGPALRTCTLVTHLLAVRSYARRADPAVSVGVGVGVGF